MLTPIASAFDRSDFLTIPTPKRLMSQAELRHGVDADGPGASDAYPPTPRGRRTGAASALVTAASCAELTTVAIQAVVEAAVINPVTCSRTLSKSAPQDVATNHGTLTAV